jgi:hypothetical protein
MTSPSPLRTASGSPFPVRRMVQRILVLHPKTARHARYQSKPGRSRQTHEYPFHGMAAGDFYDQHATHSSRWLQCTMHSPDPLRPLVQSD